MLREESQNVHVCDMVNYIRGFCVWQYFYLLFKIEWQNPFHMSRLSETGLFCKMLLSAKGEVFYIGVWLLPQTAMSFILETYNLKKVSFFFSFYAKICILGCLHLTNTFSKMPICISSSNNNNNEKFLKSQYS